MFFSLLSFYLFFKISFLVIFTYATLVLNIGKNSLIDNISFKKSFMEGDTFQKVHLQTLEYRADKNQSNKFDVKSQWSEWGKRQLLTYEQTCVATHYAPFGNGFFGAFLQAYNKHGDVKITPDDVWLVVMFYFSKYVNDHSEELRHAFVSHEGKKKLVVTTWNELLETQWDQFFTLMIEEIRKNTTKGVTQKLESNFSTTGRIQRLISIATVMNTYQQYFSYGRCIPLCGIQNVHFGGTLDDWKNLKSKMECLRQYDVNGKINDYVKKVSYIIDKFIQTYQGNVDLDFWNKIVNSERGRLGSGSTTKYSGWLIHFFGLDGSVEEVNLQSLGFDIEIDNKITGIQKTVRLVGGFKAISKEGQIYRPHLSFAIQDASNPKKNEQEHS